MRNGRGEAVRRKSRKTTDGGKAPRRCSREVYWLGLRTSQVQSEGKRVVGEWVAPIPLCQEKKNCTKCCHNFGGLKKNSNQFKSHFRHFFGKKIAKKRTITGDRGLVRSPLALPSPL